MTRIEIAECDLFYVVQALRQKVKDQEKALRLSEALALREASTREALQSQLLQIRFDKAKAFQEIENAKVHRRKILQCSIDCVCSCICQLNILSLEKENRSLQQELRQETETKSTLQEQLEDVQSENSRLQSSIAELSPLHDRHEALEVVLVDLLAGEKLLTEENVDM